MNGLLRSVAAPVAVPPSAGREGAVGVPGAGFDEPPSLRATDAISLLSSVRVEVPMSFLIRIRSCACVCSTTSPSRTVPSL
ncbi:MAG: hypothetical protein ACK55O_14065, partial [Phycisphaerales bacterium]